MPRITEPPNCIFFFKYYWRLVKLLPFSHIHILMERLTGLNVTVRFCTRKNWYGTTTLCSLASRVLYTSPHEVTFWAIMHDAPMAKIANRNANFIFSLSIRTANVQSAQRNYFRVSISIYRYRQLLLFVIKIEFRINNIYLINYYYYQLPSHARLTGNVTIKRFRQTTTHYYY